MVRVGGMWCERGEKMYVVNISAILGLVVGGVIVWLVIRRRLWWLGSALGSLALGLVFIFAGLWGSQETVREPSVVWQALAVGVGCVFVIIAALFLAKHLSGARREDSLAESSGASSGE